MYNCLINNKILSFTNKTIQLHLTLKQNQSSKNFMKILFLLDWFLRIG